MKKIILFWLMLFAGPIMAEDQVAYVTDDIKFTLRSTESNRSKILKMVGTGTQLTVLSENKATGYTKVRTAGGIEGYILSRYLSATPIHKILLKHANTSLEELRTAHSQLQAKLAQLQGNNESALTSNQSLSDERDQLSRELNELKQTAANAVQLKHQRDQLQERVISVERELQQLKRENQALADNSNQDWFLYGGLLSLFGVILGFILPKLSWRQRTSRWDTF